MLGVEEAVLTADQAVQADQVLAATVALDQADQELLQQAQTTLDQAVVAFTLVHREQAAVV
jgi:hypothetical protein